MRTKLTLLFISLTALSGCATMNKINRDSIQDFDKADVNARAHLAEAQPRQHKVELVRVSTLPYVNTQSVKAGTVYPRVFSQPANLNAPTQSVWGLLQSIHTLTGFAVNADDDLLNGGSATGGGMGAGLPPSPLGANESADTSPLVGNGGRASIGAIAYQGSLKGLLDRIAGMLDATWSYDANARQIHFYRYETRIFHIAAVPGDAATDSSVGGEAGSGVQGGQGQQVRMTQPSIKTGFTGKLNVWTTLVANIKPMLSPGGAINVSEPTATISVRDRWDRVAKIAQYVDGTNDSLAMQVQINVTVYRVKASDGDTRGFNWSMLYNALGQNAGAWGMTFASKRPTADGLSSVILSPPAQRANGTVPPFAGSQFFIDALSTLGKTSVVTTAAVDTVNNTPAPVKVVQSTAYVAETTSLLTSGGSGNNGAVGAGATLTPGSVETGFNMQVLPSVQPDGHRMLMQVMISISTLDDLKVFTSGGQTVQLPQVSAREFMQRVWMKSGEALVLAGFQNADASNVTQSPLDKSVWALGGSRTVSRAHDALVVVITPVASSPKSLN